MCPLLRSEPLGELTLRLSSETSTLFSKRTLTHGGALPSSAAEVRSKTAAANWYEWRAAYAALTRAASSPT